MQNIQQVLSKNRWQFKSE